jgi:hypothetical protein
METQELLECGHVESPHSEITSGYGSDEYGNRYCYDCCNQKEIDTMLETKRATMYLVKEGDNWYVTNWIGNIRYLASVKKGRHNIARTRYDAWFHGPMNTIWHGVQYGENTQIIRCKEIKHF